MAITALNTIKSWFQKYDYPTEEQFSSAWDSFWHKLESIAMTSIDGLAAALNLKADIEYVDNSLAPITAALANYRYGRVTVTEGGTQVTFDTPYEEGDDYLILCNCRTADGEVGYVISDNDLTGFKVLPAVDAIFEYQTIKIGT
jgi:hypothetical protein